MTDIGDTIPDIALTAPNGSSVSAADYAGKAWVLYFYPKDDTSGCTKEAQEFSAHLAEFEAAGVSVLAYRRIRRKSIRSSSRNTG